MLVVGVGHYFFRCKMIGEKSSKLDFKELKFGEVAGKGATSVVYKGEWRGNQVAIKKLLEIDEKEIEILNKLAHPNIVKFLGSCTMSNFDFCIVTGELIPSFI